MVANERPDLEKSYNVNTKEAFENIKVLKENEETILRNLQAEITTEMLYDNTLIKSLKESKQSAEVVAYKLKKIFQTN